MPRQRTVIVDQDEDIVSYEHHLAGKFVRVLVGFGTAMPDGSFIPSEDQNYENYIIQEPAYSALMAATDTKPAGVFRKDDLWQYIDIGRQKMIDERQAIAAERATNENLIEPVQAKKTAKK